MNYSSIVELLVGLEDLAAQRGFDTNRADLVAVEAGAAQAIIAIDNFIADRVHHTELARRRYYPLGWRANTVYQRALLFLDQNFPGHGCHHVDDYYIIPF
jgi:hypothetical protein